MKQALSKQNETSLRALHRSQRGATMLEYLLIVGSIVFFCAPAFGLFGKATNAKLDGGGLASIRGADLPGDLPYWAGGGSGGNGGSGGHPSGDSSGSWSGWGSGRDAGSSVSAGDDTRSPPDGTRDAPKKSQCDVESKIAEYAMPLRQKNNEIEKRWKDKREKFKKKKKDEWEADHQSWETKDANWKKSKAAFDRNKPGKKKAPDPGPKPKEPKEPTDAELNKAADEAKDIGPEANINKAASIAAYKDKDGKCQYYFGSSGEKNPSDKQICAELKKNMKAVEGKNLVPWVPQNCAEFKSSNNALNDNKPGKLTDLEVYTVHIGTGTSSVFKPNPRCDQCQITTNGTQTFSDPEGPNNNLDPKVDPNAGLVEAPLPGTEGGVKPAPWAIKK